MPSNIALVKYWGKRCDVLNLPLVSSLSRTLGDYGTTTSIALSEADSVEMNGQILPRDNKAAQRIMAFLDLFRAPGECFAVSTRNNIPTAAGVASSASGFAALTAAMAQLKKWNVSLKELSMLARLGSGSAARSFWSVPVLWKKGESPDGMDCFAAPCARPLPPFGMAVLILETATKAWSSGEAMGISLASSPLARDWPAMQQAHLDAALVANDFDTLGQVVEENAVLMHRLLAESAPSIVFDTAATREWKQTIRNWRGEGMPVYFTQDAGANLKLLYPPEYARDIEYKLKQRAIDCLIV